MMLITTLVVSFLVCWMLEVKCGYAGVVSGLQPGLRVILCYIKNKIPENIERSTCTHRVSHYRDVQLYLRPVRGPEDEFTVHVWLKGWI